MDWTSSDWNLSNRPAMHLQGNLSETSFNLTSAEALVGVVVTAATSTNTSANATAKVAQLVDEQDCNEWQDAQHFLYQLANLCLTVAFLLPYSFQYHAFCMRCIFILASLFLVIWGGSIVCNADVMGWYIAFLVVNIAYCFYAGYAAYPVSFHPELEDLYLRMFKPLQVSRFQFRELTVCGQIKDLPKDATYAVEGVTHLGEKLSILLTGRLKVTCEDLLLHTIQPNQFVDSPEYESAIDNTDSEEAFQVSITAMEDSHLLTWQWHDLHQFLDTQPFMSSLLTILLGKDVTHKLHQVQELLLHNPQYVRIITSQCSLLQLGHQTMYHGGSTPGGGGALQALMPQQTSPDSCSSSVSRSDGLNCACSRGRAVTPVRPCSPSEISWETCV